MPAYGGNGTAELLNANRTMYFWENEIVPVATLPGSLSTAYQLERLPNVVYPWGFAVEVQFNGNPGTSEVDIMGAETDNSANYLKIGSITTFTAPVAGQYVGRFETTSLYPKYVALLMLTLGNSFPVTAKISR